MLPSANDSFHAVRRRLAAVLRDVAPVDTPKALETVSPGYRDAPSVQEAAVLEGDRVRARAVRGRSGPLFEAFLDGSQLTLVAGWQGTIPIVHGTVSAVIRRRQDRRLTTWARPIIRRALFVPLPLLSSDARRALDQTGADVIDTMTRRDAETHHPLALQELAYQAVMAARARAEAALAARWCAAERGLLCVDGGIPDDPEVAVATHVVGVVKSHHCLYAGADALAVVIALGTGERSSVVRVESAGRAPVASWYLRTMEPEGRDPFWGLVRVEVSAAPGTAGDALTRRADEVSRWILAERLPLSVPDPRWDKMPYGIRDAEEYLRAVQ